METVFVAMSGGMDSSFAAHILKQKNYKVVGITFQLLPEKIKNIKSPKACCSSEMINRAKSVADSLLIPHHVINLTKEFEEHVIENFIKEYRSGRTPNPCIMCNRHIKFSSFLNKALSAGADKIATGHYANIYKTNEGYILTKGIDAEKDQSYFLYSIKKDLLEHILLPVGHYTKTSLKKWNDILKLNYQKARESQDICFIKKDSYREFLSGFVELRSGPVYSVEGKFLGHHEGIHLYTIGQRRGLNIPYTEPLYIIDIIVEENTIIAGPKKYLKKSKLFASDINMLNNSSSENFAAGKIRYRQKEEPCRYRLSDSSLEVEFENPVTSITPGQSVVLYDDDIVLGGGIIDSSAL